VAAELELKIEENEALHMSLFEIRQATAAQEEAWRAADAAGAARAGELREALARKDAALVDARAALAAQMAATAAATDRALVDAANAQRAACAAAAKEAALRTAAETAHTRLAAAVGPVDLQASPCVAVLAPPHVIPPTLPHGGGGGGDGNAGAPVAASLAATVTAAEAATTAVAEWHRAVAGLPAAGAPEEWNGTVAGIGSVGAALAELQGALAAGATIAAALATVRAAAHHAVSWPPSIVRGANNPGGGGWGGAISQPAVTALVAGCDTTVDGIATALVGRGAAAVEALADALHAMLVRWASRASAVAAGTAATLPVLPSAAAAEGATALRAIHSRRQLCATASRGADTTARSLQSVSIFAGALRDAVAPAAPIHTALSDFMDALPSTPGDDARGGLASAIATACAHGALRTGHANGNAVRSVLAAACPVMGPLVHVIVQSAAAASEPPSSAAALIPAVLDVTAPLARDAQQVIDLVAALRELALDDIALLPLRGDDAAAMVAARAAEGAALQAVAAVLRAITTAASDSAAARIVANPVPAAAAGALPHAPAPHPAHDIPVPVAVAHGWAVASTPALAPHLRATAAVDARAATAASFVARANALAPRGSAVAATDAPALRARAVEATRACAAAQLQASALAALVAELEAERDRVTVERDAAVDAAAQATAASVAARAALLSAVPAAPDRLPALYDLPPPPPPPCCLHDEPLHGVSLEPVAPPAPPPSSPPPPPPPPPSPLPPPPPLDGTAETLRELQRELTHANGSVIPALQHELASARAAVASATARSSSVDATVAAAVGDARRAAAAEAEELQAAHEALVAMMSETYQAQIRELSEVAAVADTTARRLEDSLASVESRTTRCLRCGTWVTVGDAVASRGACTACGRTLEAFR